MKLSSRRGEVGAKLEEQLRRAAAMHLQTGDFLKYCALMVEVGDWPAALAVAPVVSLEYWRHLCFHYGLVLRGNMSEQCVAYFLSCGRDRDAVDFYLSRGDSDVIN